MSRLDSFIRRMSAQRDLLNAIAAGALPEGPVVELGLGNGRTYSHLCELFPMRRILVFDRQMLANPASVPPEKDLVLGEIAESAPPYARGEAALLHVDIGSGNREKDARDLGWLPPLVARFMRPGGVVASGLPLNDPDLLPAPLPSSVPPDRYFLYHRA